MESLVRTPQSEVTATLERLAYFGITPEYFKEIRSNDDIARAVAEAWKAAMENRYADREVESNFTYPDEYQLGSIEAQIKALLAISAFKDLDVSWALEKGQVWYDNLKLTEWVEGPLVYIWHGRFGGYHTLLELVLSAIAESRTLFLTPQRLLNEKYLRQSERSVNAEKSIKAHQPGDVIIVPSQAGKRFCGKAVKRARVLYDPNEFGLGAVAEGCRALSHPKRFVCWDQLHVDCGGDEFAPAADGDFYMAPCFRFHYGGRFMLDIFNTFSVGDTVGRHGSSSGLVPRSSRKL